MRKTTVTAIALVFAALLAIPSAAQEATPDTKPLKITITDPNTGESLGNIMFMDLPSEEPARAEAFERLQISLSLLRYPFDAVPPTNPGRPGDVASLARNCGDAVCIVSCDENGENCKTICSSQDCGGGNDTCVCVVGIGIGGGRLRL